ncbi:uncharacterized protein PAC_08622 [Phialocephala subalpina]|uniref:Uncharacterized protein n=1 Tax=Phialocephala subalpina TaxID=576137 RepID=A0A1L7X145_9HELO|nr:uncharacterized protein PAC_08622 [Phialocephala subalpina]
MDNDFQNLLGPSKPLKRRGLWSFITQRTALFFAILSGLILIGLTVWFTYWLAIQTFNCPDWALHCKLQPSVSWIKANLPLVQSIVSTVHGFGLALLAYPAFILAEAALWPILTHHSYTLASLDMYLSATHGSVPGLLQAIWNIGRGKASAVMICVGLVTVLLQADRLVIGQVYTLGNVTKTYESEYWGGAGIGLTFDQQYPPGPLPAPVTSASSFYTSWSKNLSSEPLPEIKDFIVDRTTLAQVGNFSIPGLKASKSITCTGQPLDITDDTDGLVFGVASNYPKANSSVRLRMAPRLAVWVDQVDYNSSHRTITSLVFASINGTIENGISTNATKKMKKSNHHIDHISALKCAVNFTLEQATVKVGTGSGHNGGLNLSSVETFSGPGHYHSPHGRLGDVAEWMGAVITTLGNSVYGAQPLFSHEEHSLPRIFTTTQGGEVHENCTQDELINFIDVASGALALSMSTQWNEANITLSSDMSEKQLIASKSWYLLVPAAIVLLTEVFLAVWLSHTYRKARVTEVRRARTREMIGSTQNRSLREGVEELRSSPKACEQLEQMKVRYGLLADEHTHMGLLWDEQKQDLNVLLGPYPK